MDWEREWERLNAYQREAVINDEKACLVKANVGSGKTTVLIAKILYLHVVKRVSYHNMVVLTFTNRAADEIRERLISVDVTLPEAETELFGTFHGVALKLLKNRLLVERLGYTRDFLVMEPEEELELALWLTAERKLKIKYKNRLKKRLSQAERAPGAGNVRIQDDLEVLAALLEEEKRRRNKMTFSDLMKNVCLLTAEPDGDEHGGICRDVQWVIVDEVQDCDEKQLELIDRFMAGGAKLFAVGDPNQVIYSWRGSAFNIFYTLKAKYQAAELSLPVNYRSSNEILEAARCFQQNGGGLEGTRGNGEKIVVKNHYDSFQEACCLADRIRDFHEQGIAFGDMAVFYRLQSQSKVLEDVFLKEGIPCEAVVKTGIHEIAVMEWLLRLLRYLADPADCGAAVFVLSSREYGLGISPKKAEKLVRERLEERLKNSSRKREKTAPGERENGESRLLEKMVLFAENSGRIRNTNDFYEYFELDSSFKPNASSYEEDKANAWRFLNRMFAFLDRKGLAFPEGLREFLNSSALYGIDRELLPEVDRGEGGRGDDCGNSGERDCKDDRVKLMTLHASKGLEFSHVFIIGVNDGLIPLKTKGMEGEEEERRLFFVGLTRARNYLELSWYTNPDTFGVMGGEGRYIRVIPPGLVRREGQAGKAGTANLQELRRQVQMAKEDGEKARMPEAEEAGSEEIGEVRHEETLVRHETYGCGRVVGEDDTMITVEFDGYGRKEFVKAFSCLEVLKN